MIVIRKNTNTPRHVSISTNTTPNNTLQQKQHILHSTRHRGEVTTLAGPFLNFTPNNPFLLRWTLRVQRGTPRYGCNPSKPAAFRPGRGMRVILLLSEVFLAFKMLRILSVLIYMFLGFPVQLSCIYQVFSYLLNF